MLGTTVTFLLQKAWFASKGQHLLSCHFPEATPGPSNWGPKRKKTGSASLISLFQNTCFNWPVCDKKLNCFLRWSTFVWAFRPKGDEEAVLGHTSVLVSAEACWILGSMTQAGWEQAVHHKSDSQLGLSTLIFTLTKADLLTAGQPQYRLSSVLQEGVVSDIGKAFVCLFGILFLKQSQNIRQALLCLSSPFSSKDLCKVILNTSSTSFFTALISYQGRLIDSAPLKSALWERSAVRSEELTFLPMIAGMFISADGPDKTGLLLFYGFSKQKNTICNDLGDREQIQERIFYMYLVICRGSWTRLRKRFYKATVFLFFQCDLPKNRNKWSVEFGESKIPVSKRSRD